MVTLFCDRMGFAALLRAGLTYKDIMVVPMDAERVAPSNWNCMPKKATKVLSEPPQWYPEGFDPAPANLSAPNDDDYAVGFSRRM